MQRAQTCCPHHPPGPEPGWDSSLGARWDGNGVVVHGAASGVLLRSRNPKGAVCFGDTPSSAHGDTVFPVSPFAVAARG